MGYIYDLLRWPESMRIIKSKQKRSKHSRPQFKHDCVSCKYLGRYQNTDEKGEVWKYDLYYCGDNGSHATVHATVIARFGNEGSEYQSGLLGCHNLDELAEAKKRAIQKGYLTQTASASSPSATEIKPRFKFAASEYLKFVCQSNLGMSPCDVYVDANGGIIAAYPSDTGHTVTIKLLDEKCKGSPAYKEAIAILGLSSTATEFYSRYSIIGYCVLRIWAPTNLRKCTKFDYVNKTWCRQNQDGTISSGASYTGASQPIFSKEIVDKLNKGVAIYSSRVRAERIIPLIENEWKDCEFCVMPVMEKRDYSKEKGKSEVLIKSETFIPTSEI